MGNQHSESQGGERNQKFNATKFKEASESCYDALPAKATCNGIIADHFPKAEKCWKMGAAAGGACAPEDIFEWAKGKIDGTLADAKSKFKQSAEPCLKQEKLKKECGNDEKNENAINSCWKQAEEAAGGTWKQEKDSFPEVECPSGWLYEIKEVTEYEEWYGETCVKSESGK